MVESAANVAGSVTVQIGGSLGPLEAALAKAEQMTRAFDARMASATSGTGVSANLSKVNATIAETAATLSKATEPAAAAAAKIAAVGSSAVTAAAGIEPLRLSAKDVAAAMAGGGLTAANLNAAIEKLAPTTSEAAVATASLAEASAAATVSMGALGVAETEAAGLGAGVTREFMVLGSEVARGNFSRIPGSLIVLNERLLSTGTGVLTMKNAMGALGALGSTVFNPYIVGFLAITIGIEVVSKLFEHIISGGQKATDVLKEHDAWLKTILKGYDGIQKAADAYEKTANMLPQGAVTSDLSKKASDDLAAYKAALLSVKQVQTDFLAGYIQANDAFKDVGPATAQAAALQDLQKQFSLTNPDLATLITKLTQVKNSDADAMVRQVAEQMLTAATNAQTLNVALGTTITSLNKIGEVNFSGLQGVDDLVKKLHALTPETRSPTEQAKDAFTLGIGQARTTSEVTAAVNAYNAAIKAINTKAADQLGAKGASAFDTTTNSILKQTDALKSQATTYGMSTAAIEAAKIQQQLLTAAEQDHLKLSPKLLAQINAQAQAYGAAAQAAKFAALANNDNTARSMLGLNSTDQNIAGQFGNDWASQMNGPIAQSMRLTAALSDLKAEAENAGNTFVSTFVNDLRNGTPVIQSFADAAIAAFDQIAQKLEQMAIDNLVSNAFGGLTGGGSSGGLFGGILSLFGLGGSGGLPSGIGQTGGFGSSYATGGYISGPGTGTSDSINARLSNGEFVVKASAVSANLPKLVAMNKGYADGGLVGSNNNTPSASNSNGPSIIFAPVINAQGAQMGVADQIVTALETFSSTVLPSRLQQIAEDGRARG